MIVTELASTIEWIVTELAPTIIAGIALIISIISIIITYKQNQKLSALNMQSRYYEKIFDEYLINKIPKGRKYLKYLDDGSFTGANKLIDTLSDLKNESLYFKYHNEEFYDDLVNLIETLEKILTDFSNSSEKDQDRQYKNLDKIKSKIVDIYQLIYKNANGAN